MLKEIELNGKTIQYDLQYKRVKNINLRINADGAVCVSASRRVSQRIIEGFLMSKAELILKAMEKYKSRRESPKIRYFSESEIQSVIEKLCEKAYPYYKKIVAEYPQIKFRKMVSRWGSCCPANNVLTFNINLMYAPMECVEYIVWHEFTHFFQQNHSVRFYEELSKVCPCWKECRKKLREISLR